MTAEAETDRREDPGQGESGDPFGMNEPVGQSEPRAAGKPGFLAAACGAGLAAGIRPAVAPAELDPDSVHADGLRRLAGRDDRMMTSKVLHALVDAAC